MLLLCRRRRSPITAADAGPPSGGDASLQESLVRMVRLQMGQEKVKDSVEEERQKLQQLADEVCWSALPTVLRYHHILPFTNSHNPSHAAAQAKEEVDRLQQLTMDRSNLAFGSVMVPCHYHAHG